MRLHKISDWNIWYGMFGKSDYANQMSNFTAFRGIIYLSIVLPFQLFVVLPFKIFLLLADYVSRDIKLKKIEEIKESNRSANMYNEIISLVPKVEVQPNKSLRKKYANKIIALLNALENMGRSYLFSNFEELRWKMKIVLKTADALDYLDKADKQNFFNKKKIEINYLFEALYSLKKEKVTIKEFNSLQAKSEITGQTWTVDYIKRRLLSAGYTPTK
ncbi:MAG: hypothetical protein J0652_00385 [Desulfobulbaceae bacterium]|nr:hypothetical protein [Desulfobulbaceae bacterium]